MKLTEGIYPKVINWVLASSPARQLNTESGGILSLLKNRLNSKPIRVKQYLPASFQLPLILLFVFIMASGCSSHRDRLNVDVSAVKIPDIKIHRYDRDLFTVGITDLRSGLERIQHNYYFFLGTDLSDPKKLAEMKEYLENPRTVGFQKACEKQYKDVSKIETELTDAFRHWKFYFPEARIPRVYSYISGGDYNNPVQLVDSVLIIGLDNYLGKDFKPYFADGLALYEVERMDGAHIVPDCAKEIVNGMYPVSAAPNTLLSGMVEAGKHQYLVNALIPHVPANLRMNYTKSQYDWVEKNEIHVWAALVENRLLYSSDGQYFRMFLADSPCTMEFSKESPPRLGEWIGYKIVRSYMQNNKEVTLQMLMKETDAQKILTLSGYKPEK